MPTIAPNSRYINNNKISSILAEVFSDKSKKVKNADQTIAEPLQIKPDNEKLLLESYQLG